MNRNKILPYVSIWCFIPRTVELHSEELHSQGALRSLLNCALWQDWNTLGHSQIDYFEEKVNRLLFTMFAFVYEERNIQKSLTYMIIVIYFYQ